MQMFNWKTIPGWSLIAFSLCWRFLGIWARIEFVFKKIWPDKSIATTLAVIASSPWFSIVIIFVGLAWIWWFSRNINPQYAEDKEWVPLKKLIRKIYEELEETAQGRKFIEKYIMAIIPSIRKNDQSHQESVVNFIAEYFIKSSVSIYGKTPPSTNLRKIDKSIFKFIHSFNNEASTLTFSDEIFPTFIDLSIKKSELNKAIKEIISLANNA